MPPAGTPSAPSRNPETRLTRSIRGHYPRDHKHDDEGGGIV
jgi:hypothetical protein